MDECYRKWVEQTDKDLALHIAEGKDEALFWAGKMAVYGAAMLRVDLLSLLYHSLRFRYALTRYDAVIFNRTFKDV